MLVAALPAMNHLGVSHIREQLLLSFLEFFCRVIAIHGKQMMAKPVHPLFLLHIHYHGHHHPDQGDEEERPQHIAHHRVAVGLGGIGHCRVTHDISSQMAEWMDCMGSGGLGRAPPLGSLGRRKGGYQLYLW